MSEYAQLLARAAAQVKDPLSGGSVQQADMARNARLHQGTLVFDLVFKAEHTPAQRRGIDQALTATLRAEGWEGEVDAMWHIASGAKVAGHQAAPGAVKTPQHRGLPPVESIPGVKHIVAVASGKGGVGKSTIATNLAVGLRRAGYTVGLLDADVYGPSLPRMMGVTEAPTATEAGFVPVMAHDIKCLSIGLLVGESDAIIWRGPMVTSLLKKFLHETLWGELDYLIVDMPPGTGDAQLTLVQAVPLSGAVVVTTPQDVALVDAIRGVSMFEKVDVPVLGIVETMSWYELPDGSRDYVFGEGGGARVAQRYGIELLAQFPLLTAVRRAQDAGIPPAVEDDELGASYRVLAQRVAAKLA